MDLLDYMFPVVERPVAVNNWPEQLSATENQNTANQYKVIVREDTNEIISVVRDSYKLVPNAELINRMSEELDGLGMTSYIDESHSFVDNHRMRLQITFPEITLKDNESEIALSLFLHNSYDMSESVRLFFGAIRHVCSNGMVFGRILTKYFARHTKRFSVGDLQKNLETVCEQLPLVQDRITMLASQPVTEELRNRVRREVGVRMAALIFGAGPKNQWEAFNQGTNLISHAIDQNRRARFQVALGRAFTL